MLLIKTYTAPDAFGGTGLFANEFVTRGSTVWAFDPRIDVFFSYAAYKGLALPLRRSIDKFVYPARHNGIEGVMYSCDNDRFTNHSFTPNTGTWDDGLAIALCDIQRGEEITANYFDFLPQGLPEFYKELPGYLFLLPPTGQNMPIANLARDEKNSRSTAMGQERTQEQRRAMR